MEQPDLELLKRQALFKGLTEEELEEVRKLLVLHEYESYDSIIEEGDTSTDIYLIAEGEVAVLKWDDLNLFQILIRMLQAGDMFGELSFLDLSPRSTSIESRKHTKLYSLSREEMIKPLPSRQTIYNKIITNIATINAERFRVSNESYVKTLRSSVYTLKVQLSQSVFISVMAVLFGLFNLVYLIPAWTELSPQVIAWVGWIAMVIPVACAIRKFHFYLSDLGWGREPLKKLIRETLFALGLGIIGLGLVKLIVSHLATPTSPLIISRFYWIALYFLYCVAYEFIARGVLQTTLKSVLKNERNWKILWLSAALVTFIPLFTYGSISWVGVSLTLMANVALGKVYLSQNNLAGVIFLHFIIGLLANYLRVI